MASSGSRTVFFSAGNLPRHAAPGNVRDASRTCQRHPGPHVPIRRRAHPGLAATFFSRKTFQPSRPLIMGLGSTRTAHAVHRMPRAANKPFQSPRSPAAQGQAGEQRVARGQPGRPARPSQPGRRHASAPRAQRSANHRQARSEDSDGRACQSEPASRRASRPATAPDRPAQRSSDSQSGSFPVPLPGPDSRAAACRRCS